MSSVFYSLVFRVAHTNKNRFISTFRAFALLPIYGAKNCPIARNKDMKNETQYKQVSGNNANALLAVVLLLYESVSTVVLHFCPCEKLSVEKVAVCGDEIERCVTCPREQNCLTVENDHSLLCRPCPVVQSKLSIFNFC